MRRLTAAALLLLAACSTPTTKPAPEPLPSLSAEQRWLGDLFKGTPVQVFGDDDGHVVVELAQPHAFDPGQAAPSAKLAAVLDKVATSLRRAAQAKVRISVLNDGDAALAKERAARVRGLLYTKGVLESRITVDPQNGRKLVRLKMYLPPAAVPASSKP